ncbi:MAG: winged helix DNA-binding protein [Chloroflexi bacterium]|jgi:DNA-binding MarR family transcriptional regulator|nr:winged helix DNA-binding protein [Chloroflexota bacterium]
MSPAEEPQYELSQDEEAELWALLSQVRKELLTASDRELRPLGVSTVQLGILHALKTAYEAGVSPSLSDLSRWVIRQHNTVSVILDGMEKRGLVQLDRTSQPKRTVRISITEKGQDIYNQHMHNRKNIPQILGSLSPGRAQPTENTAQETGSEVTRYSIQIAILMRSGSTPLFASFPIMYSPLVIIV